MTTSRLLLAIAILTAVAACKIVGDETRSGASAACVDVGAACGKHSDCCSYGCISGVCVANAVEGGVCRTTNDCAYPRLCKSAACTTVPAGTCRDEADVCTVWSQCCTGNCGGGLCTQNRAPIADAGPLDVPDVPYTKLYTLTNASSDPDGDPLVYGWSFTYVPPGSAAALSGAAVATPSFTPDKVGDYVVRLVVTDGPTGAPNRLTSETQVTIHVVNRDPQPTAAAQPSATCAPTGGQLSCSRNNPVRIAATAADPDGDALECAWRVTEPGAAQPTVLADFAPCANPSSATLDYTPTGEGTYLVEYVVRDHDRTTGTVVHTVAAGATFVSRNDPPTPVLSRAPYFANMGATPATTPAVALDASASTDPNGDQLLTPALSFFWEMIAWPGSTGPTPPAAPPIVGFDTTTPSFVPFAEGAYVLRVTVSDQAQFGRASASTPQDVTVNIGRYVQPLGHAVADSARAADVDKIVLVGTDPTDATKGMIWTYDEASGTEGAGLRIADSTGASGIPRLVDVTPDGTKAVVVDTTLSIWVVTFGATSPIVRFAQPFTVNDVVVAGNRYAYLFAPGSVTTLNTIRELDLQNGTLAATSPPGWAGYGGFGAAYHSGTTNGIYRVDDVFHDWDRYTVNNSGAASSSSAYGTTAPTCGTGYPTSYATGIWVTQNATFANAYVIDSCGGVYNASSSTLAPITTASLGMYPSHVDSTAAGAVLACGGSTLSQFNATLQPAGTDVIPVWSQNGFGRTAFAAKAFFDAEVVRP